MHKAYAYATVLLLILDLHKQYAG